MCSFFPFYFSLDSFAVGKGKSAVTDIKTDNKQRAWKKNKIKIIYTTLKVSIKNTVFFLIGV